MPFNLIRHLESRKGLLKPSDIMQLTNYGRTKVYEMLDSGEIPPFRFSKTPASRKTGRGKSYRVDPQEWADRLRDANPELLAPARTRKPVRSVQLQEAR